MSTPIVTTAKLAAHLSGDQQAAIDAATQVVRSYCGWHVTPVVSESVALFGNGSTVLQLPTLHVVSVTSVSDESGAPVTGYRVARQGYLFGPRWGMGRVYTVVLEHGVAEAEDVAGVVLRAAASAAQSPYGQLPTSVSLGSARIALGSNDSKVQAARALPQSDLAILDRYKLPPLP